MKVSTKINKVSYNAGNRPILWTNTATGVKIHMIYDSHGRRIEKRVVNAAGHRTLRERYVYVGYTCVQILNGDANNAVVKEFVWDPTEPMVTRPLKFAGLGRNLFYMHDGNKNVSDMVYLALNNKVGAHYEYAPFGAITRATRDTPDASKDILNQNPFRFSSEFFDPELGLVYYNYRHYSPTDGRFLSRDPIAEQGGLNLYVFVGNSPIGLIDVLGLSLSRSDIEKLIASIRLLLEQVRECYKSKHPECCADMYKQYLDKLSQLTRSAGDFYKDLWWISDADQQLMEDVYRLPVSVEGMPIDPTQLSNLRNAISDSGNSIDDNIFNKYEYEFQSSADFAQGFSDGVLFGFGEDIARMVYGDDTQWANINSNWYLGGVGAGVAATAIVYGCGGLPKTMTHFSTAAGARGIHATGVINATKIGLFGPGTYMAQIGRPLNLFVPKLSTVPIQFATPPGTIRIIPKLIYLRPFRGVKIP